MYKKIILVFLSLILVFFYLYLNKSNQILDITTTATIKTPTNNSNKTIIVEKVDKNNSIINFNSFLFLTLEEKYKILKKMYDFNLKKNKKDLYFLIINEQDNELRRELIMLFSTKFIKTNNTELINLLIENDLTRSDILEFLPQLCNNNEIKNIYINYSDLFNKDEHISVLSSYIDSSILNGVNPMEDALILSKIEKYLSKEEISKNILDMLYLSTPNKDTINNNDFIKDFLSEPPNNLNIRDNYQWLNINFKNSNNAEKSLLIEKIFNKKDNTFIDEYIAYAPHHFNYVEENTGLEYIENKQDVLLKLINNQNNSISEIESNMEVLRAIYYESNNQKFSNSVKNILHNIDINILDNNNAKMYIKVKESYNL